MKEVTQNQTEEVLLEIKNTTYFVPQIEKPILNNLQYKVFSGDFVIILGSNGSGKSTLLKLIDRRATVPNGKIFLKGKDINQYSQKYYAQKVKTLTQNYNDSLFPTLSLFENYLIANNKRIKNQKTEREFLQDYLAQFNPKLSTKLDQLVDALSGGEKQTVALALTILHPPLLLLLDEHTSALDPKTAELNMQLTTSMVIKHKITCLLTTHNLRMAEQYGNRILAIQHGDIVARIDSQEKHKLTDKLMYQMFY